MGVAVLATSTLRGTGLGGGGGCGTGSLGDSCGWLAAVDVAVRVSVAVLWESTRGLGGSSTCGGLGGGSRSGAGGLRGGRRFWESGRTWAANAWVDDIVGPGLESKVDQAVGVLGGVDAVHRRSFDDLLEVFGVVLDVALAKGGHVEESVHEVRSLSTMLAWRRIEALLMQSLPSTAFAILVEHSNLASRRWRGEDASRKREGK